MKELKFPNSQMPFETFKVTGILIYLWRNKKFANVRGQYITLCPKIPTWQVRARNLGNKHALMFYDPNLETNE